MSPQAFDQCVKDGGRVRTLKVGKDKFQHVCYLNGKSYKGYIKTKKKEG